jgi:hypothetical protein
MQWHYRRANIWSSTKTNALLLKAPEVAIVSENESKMIRAMVYEYYR